MDDSTGSQAEEKKQSGWGRPLARPVVLRDGASLVTLADVRTFLFKRLNTRALESADWRRVTALLLSAARSDDVDITDLTIALEVAASMAEASAPEAK